MDVSIIIINYNTTNLTKDCIQSIYDLTLRNTFEIIVVDNASSDEGIKDLNSLFPKVQLILNNQNIGFGCANNQGILASKGKYIFLLNSDTYLVSDVIAVFYDFMEKKDNRHIACCGGELIKPDGTPQVSFGNFPSILEAISSLGFFIFYKRYFYRKISSGVFNYSNEIKEVDYICGADMFLRRSVVNNLGAFDPDFFLYFEETELSFRIHKMGYSSVLIPYAKIVHLEGGSLTGKIDGEYQKVLIFSKSRRLFYKKCYGKLSGAIINKIYALQALIFFVVKKNSAYLKYAKVLYRS